MNRAYCMFASPACGPRGSQPFVAQDAPCSPESTGENQSSSIACSGGAREACGPHNVRHALMTDAMHRVSDGPQRLSLAPERDHFADRLLLGLMRDELAVVAAPETKRDDPAEISTA